MNPTGAPSCPNCGGFVSTGGGRCPTCGHDLGLLPQAVPPPRMRPGVSARPRPKRSVVAPILLGGLFVVGMGTLLLIWTLGRPKPGADTAGAAPSALPAPTDSAAPDKRLDLPGALSRARKEAKGWYRDASIVSIDISPVGGAELDTDARVDVSWGKPTGRLGPGAPVGAERFIAEVGRAEVHAREERSATGKKAVAEPTCTLDAAWRAVVASGLPSSQRYAFRYEWSDKHSRAIWTVRQTAEGAAVERSIDGESCAILLR